MAKEQFCHRESWELLDVLDQAARASMKSRSQAFEDWLEMVVCALSGGRMEQQYLAIAERYAAGEQGKRGIDRLAELFGRLVATVEETRADILGDLFEGAISFGDHQQFFTPESVCDLMAQMAGTDEVVEGKTVSDPTCGSGRMLLAAAKVNPRRLFVGQDIDLRCVRMTAINLALRGLYGRVIWGNTLTMERRLEYRTGFDGVGAIRELPMEEEARAEPPREEQIGEPAPTVPSKLVQRLLFDSQP